MRRGGVGDEGVGRPGADSGERWEQRWRRGKGDRMRMGLGIIIGIVIGAILVIWLVVQVLQGVF